MFVVIILLNFLIAVISQSYENVMNSKTILEYKDVADLNKEIQVFLAAINVCKWNEPLIRNNKMILSLKADVGLNEESNEWVGFVQTMKIFVRKHLSLTNDKI